MIEAPTPWVWVIGRTQTNGPGDYAAVNAVQDGYTITPSQETRHAIDPAQAATGEPLRVVNGMSGAEFFAYACEALLVNPPHASDFSVLARIANLGIVPGKPFDPSGLSSTALSEIEAGATDAREAIAGNISGFGTRVNGWSIATETIGVYGNAYRHVQPGRLPRHLRSAREPRARPSEQLAAGTDRLARSDHASLCAEARSARRPLGTAAGSQVPSA